MIIGLNGQRLLIDKLAGPEKYTLNTFKAFAKVDQKNKYIIYFDKNPPKGFFDEIKVNNPNFSYKVVPKLLSWTQGGLALELIKNPVDIFFTAVHTMPVIKLPKVKVVGMVHGLEYRFSKRYKNTFWKNVLRLHEWYVCIFSKEVVVPSQATKNEIIKRNWIGINKEKIMVIPEGVNNTFYKRKTDEITKIRRKYNIGTNKYLLFVSTIQPRKNIPMMVKAFNKVINENKNLENVKLLISGKRGWLYGQSLEAPSKYGAEKNVVFLGFTPDEDIPILLSGAIGYISLSFEEGFGLPLLEAMACETPSVVSNIAAFKELGQEFPIYVNPHDENNIKEGILQILTTPRDENKIKRARERALQFTWENTATQIISLFERLVKNS